MSNRFYNVIYAIAYRERNENNCLYKGKNQSAFEVLKSTWRYWYADPIVFSYQGEEYLFAERMDRLRGKGILVAAKIEQNGIGEFKPVLEEPYHLSYPFVFEKSGKLYMIPESTADKSVKLYACKQFPYQWELVKVLCHDVLYADTNVVSAQSHFYLITGEMDPQIGAKTKTLVFEADGIEQGELHAFEQNKSGEFSFEQRGAGRWIEENGDLIQPTQCGDAENYGTALKFSAVSFADSMMRVQELCTVQTGEVTFHSKKNISGMHTYAQSEKYEIVDVKYTQKTNIAVLSGRVFRKISSIFNR
ncbi:MAG: hypothetical protein IJI67_07990 [Clostridia bacterium]|nr:hypothetical protein [Clostridia bacterium]